MISGCNGLDYAELYQYFFGFEDISYHNAIELGNEKEYMLFALHLWGVMDKNDEKMNKQELIINKVFINKDYLLFSYLPCPYVTGHAKI